MKTRPQDLDFRTTALSALAIVMMVAMAVAWRVDASASTIPDARPYQLTVVDERGGAVVGANLTFENGTAITDETGTAVFEFSAPELIVVRAVGLIPDAIVVGTPDAPAVTLRLLDVVGPSGRRTVMHFAGDFMMGRRYQEPTRPETPLVADEDSARAVVADIAPLFRLADVVSINYESVIGTLPPEDAYPGKRFLLQSPPETLAALDELGVNLATLGNNHINDWLDAGVAATVSHLGAAGIAHPGGGITSSDAYQPAIIDTGSVRVGVVSMTTVSGDYVNDHLPDATTPVPASIEPQDEWQFAARTFEFGTADDSAHVAPASRRAGAVWQMYVDMEPDLAGTEAAALWQAITATYPELQDWVARRGHGGAARYSQAAVEKGVADARTAGADLVVVQLHGGLQFGEVSSDFFREATHAAVDAGADLVIGHHPHVVQGFEFYKSTLISHSLGNFVFDQDFLTTHPSIILRTVFEGEKLIEATIYPVMVDDYRPVAVGGVVAQRIIRQVNEASLQAAVSLRLPDLRVGTSPDSTDATASVIADNGRGKIIPATGSSHMSVELQAGTPTEIGPALIAVDDSTTGLTIGRDIFGFGDLEDVQADGTAAGGLEWSFPPDSVQVDDSSPAGDWTVRLDRSSRNVTDTMARTAARVPLPPHRWFDETGLPIDGNPTYSVRVWVRRHGAGIPFVRVAYYEFDDTDPTRSPESKTIDTIDVQLPAVNDGEWHELWVDLPLPPGGANSALVGVGLPPPESRSGTVWIDGLNVVEWRKADQLPKGIWVLGDYVMGNSSGTVVLTTQ